MLKNNNPVPFRLKKKRFLRFSLVLLLLAVISGCGKRQEKEDTVSISSEQAMITIDNTKEQEVASQIDSSESLDEQVDTVNSVIAETDNNELYLVKDDANSEWMTGYDIQEELYKSEVGEPKFQLLDKVFSIPCQVKDIINYLEESHVYYRTNMYNDITAITYTREHLSSSIALCGEATIHFDLIDPNYRVDEESTPYYEEAVFDNNRLVEAPQVQPLFSFACDIVAPKYETWEDFEESYIIRIRDTDISHYGSVEEGKKYLYDQNDWIYPYLFNDRSAVSEYILERVPEPVPIRIEDSSKFYGSGYETTTVTWTSETNTGELVRYKTGQYIPIIGYENEEDARLANESYEATIAGNGKDHSGRFNYFSVAENGTLGLESQYAKKLFVNNNRTVCMLYSADLTVDNMYGKTLEENIFFRSSIEDIFSVEEWEPMQEINEYGYANEIYYGLPIN